MASSNEKNILKVEADAHASTIIVTNMKIDPAVSKITSQMKTKSIDKKNSDLNSLDKDLPSLNVTNYENNIDFNRSEDRY